MNDIIKHRQAVEEQIQKGFEVGFTGSDDLEKAHKVGDIHPNGKWVWTQLPSGRYDWRVIKKTAQPASTVGTAPAAQKPAVGGKTWDKISDFSKMNSVEAQLVAQWGNFTKRKDPFYMSTMCQLLDQKFPNVAQWKQTAPNTGASKITAVDADGNEIAVLDLSGGVNIPKLQTFMDKCSEVKPAKKTQVSSTKLPASYEEAVKMGQADTAKVNAYKMPTTIYQAKYDLETYRGGAGRYSNMYGEIEVAENHLRRALNRRVTNDNSGYKTEEEKLKAIQTAADELATTKAIEKRISKIYTDLKKEEKQFLAKAGRNFSEDEVEEWLKKYNGAREPAATVENTWHYSMGRIGSTKATIQVGKSKEKAFDRWDCPSWRPIGMLEYSIRVYYGNNPYVTVKKPIQSWKDVSDVLSDTEDFRVTLYKHPKQ